MATDNWGNRDFGTVECLSLTDDEKLWSLLAHLSALLVLVAPPANVLVPLILFLIYKDKSRFVAFHALQALYFQLGIVAIATLCGLASVVTLGLGLLVTIPVVLGLAVAGVVYPVIVALHAHRGELYEYPVIGEFAREHAGL